MADERLLRLMEDGSGASDALRQVLRHGQADLPSPTQLAALAHSLGPLLPPPPVTGAEGAGGVGSGSAVGATGAGVASGVGAAKLIGAVTVAALVGAGGYALSSHPDRRPPSGSESARVATHSTQAQEERTPSGPPSTPSPEIDFAPAQLPEPELKAVEQRERPAPAPQAAGAPAAASPPAAAAPPRTPSATSRPSELQLLSQAQLALKRDPERALVLAKQHRALYPQGTLAQEREVVIVSALKALGREAAARERAEGFQKQYPGSMHRERVRSGDK